MTQEELDALMNGEMEDAGDDENLASEETLLEEPEDDDVPAKQLHYDEPLGYTKNTAHHWPMPATDENKMVHQLDDVTRESEEKASEIFDIIERVSNEMMEKEADVKSIAGTFRSNIALFETLTTKFPDVKTFATSLEQNRLELEKVEAIIELLQSSGDSIMEVMDIMQYQDIHRQKIERVINVMRALSNYMNSLFEGRVADEKRVSSAQHIAGDTHNELVSDDEIEALLAKFATK